MNWLLLLSVAALVGAIVWFEWPRFNPGQKREKAAFLTLLAIGAFLAGLLIFFPEIPGPNHWIDTLFRPLGTLLDGN